MEDGLIATIVILFGIPIVFFVLVRIFGCREPSFKRVGSRLGFRSVSVEEAAAELKDADKWLVQGEKNFSLRRALIRYYSGYAMLVGDLYIGKNTKGGFFSFFETYAIFNHNAKLPVFEAMVYDPENPEHKDSDYIRDNSHGVILYESDDELLMYYPLKEQITYNALAYPELLIKVQNISKAKELLKKGTLMLMAEILSRSAVYKVVSTKQGFYTKTNLYCPLYHLSSYIKDSQRIFELFNVLKK